MGFGYGLFDTHCHLDALEYEQDRQKVMQRALATGVRGILIPAVDVQSFDKVRYWSHQAPGGAYAVGIHPMYVRYASEDSLEQLRSYVQAHIDDPHLVAIGEIGLDFFVPEISQGESRELQIHFYREQLKIARQFGLPVILHVRRSQDELLKWLRRDGSAGGIAHAFNGSNQQAGQFIEQGFALGFGGAMTYPRALQIRRLAVELPLDQIVLETDGPDIAPAWMYTSKRNEPAQVANIAQALANLRGCARSEVLEKTTQAALRVVPRTRALWT